MKYHAFLLFFSYLVFLKPLGAYIEKVTHITFKDGKELYLLYDSYSGYPKEWNMAWTPGFVLGAKNLALNNPQKKVLFSYEDPGIYFLESDAKDFFLHNPKMFTRSSNNNYIGLVLPNNFQNVIAMGFTSHKKFSSLLNGDLTECFSLVAHDLPQNLVIKSNDPRLDYLVPLLSENGWLAKNKDKFKITDFIFVNKKFYGVMDRFKMNNIILEEKRKIFYRLIREFGRVYFEQKEMFKLFVKEKGFEFLPDEFNKTLQELNEKLSLDDIKYFLQNNKNIGDTFSLTPVLDVLFSLLDEKSADINVIVLGVNNANHLANIMSEMEIIEEIEEIYPDVLVESWLNIEQDQNNGDRDF